MSVLCLATIWVREDLEAVKNKEEVFAYFFFQQQKVMEIKTQNFVVVFVGGVFRY